MHPNTLVKSTLHAISALLTLGYAVYILSHNDLVGIAYLVPGLLMAILVFAHERIWTRQALKTVLFFLFESFSLAAIAWRLYQFNWHKATFFYEG
nr:hypothetical protein [Chitinophagaceae bacterium]